VEGVWWRGGCMVAWRMCGGVEGVKEGRRDRGWGEQGDSLFDN
jgi:hypothetical protein